MRKCFRHVSKFSLTLSFSLSLTLFIYTFTFSLTLTLFIYTFTFSLTLTLFIYTYTSRSFWQVLVFYASFHIICRNLACQYEIRAKQCTCALCVGHLFGQLVIF